LLIRLVKGGDDEVLVSLFDSLDWVDDVTRRELASFFEQELQLHPEVFLYQLNGRLDWTKAQVYAMVSPSIAASTEEGRRARQHIRTSVAGTPSAPVALELFRIVDDQVAISRRTKVNTE
jgi:hypothetical protein